MTKKLVIVESPSKSKTIEKYLGTDYKVVSSLGHIRDLATTGKYGFGIDIENGFIPNYEIIKGKKKLVTSLKKDVKDSNFVYLATDPDREGEAISWHLFDALGLDKKKYKRIVFNEITKDVILSSFDKAREIDDNLVRSQETRRMLDRIIGFRLSKLMQSKTGGKSAGRVQSVALKLIVDREREIEAFIPEDYYEIDAIFNNFEAKLDSYNNMKIEIKTEEEAKDIISKLSDLFKIKSIEKQIKNKKAKAPHITSTLQQEASSKLNFTSKKTMMIAQKLYEGITLKDETVGLITYMRTDSIRLSDEFIKRTYGYIKENYGEKYLGYVKKSKKTENVQDAHEAIRPTSINRTPESIKEYLSNDEYKLYKMIYYRALASLMKDAEVEATTIILDNNNYQFKTTGSVLKFDGYLKVYSEYEDSKDTILPSFEENQELKSNEINYTKHTTKPPARYTESKLIKEMEILGIGRPSTYATTIGILSERGYVKVIEKKFHPTEVGIETTDKLQEYFKDIINVDYTKEMEDDLDKIADGNLIWTNLLNRFYNEFEPKVKEAFSNMEKKQAEVTGEMCPNCKSPLVIKRSRYGEFTACSNYPECKYIKTEKEPQKEIMDCPTCGGKIIEKKTRKGKIFYGCNNYPKCDFATWDKPTGEICPNCSKPLVETKDKIKCSKCEYER
ncbi:MAG: type I DNA topoisomerase [Bacilli bacterium]|nr:type I DNA topoisomerase [Bacilli bacterium]MBQ9854541.1 type I DNA topoisomerase [Bacilli bacterium]